jgi:hypothetical protein
LRFVRGVVRVIDVGYIVNHGCLMLVRGVILIRFYLSLVRSVAYGKSEIKLFACKEIINRW